MVITDNSFMWLFYLLTYSQLDFKILFSCPLVSILFFRVVSVCHHYSEILEAASQVHKEKKLLIFYLGGWKFIERAQDLQGPHGSSQEAVHRKAHLKRQEEKVGQLAPFKGNSLSILLNSFGDRVPQRPQGIFTRPIYKRFHHLSPPPPWDQTSF